MWNDDINNVIVFNSILANTYVIVSLKRYMYDIAEIISKDPFHALGNLWGYYNTPTDYELLSGWSGM